MYNLFQNSNNGGKWKNERRKQINIRQRFRNKAELYQEIQKKNMDKHIHFSHSLSKPCYKLIYQNKGDLICYVSQADSFHSKCITKYLYVSQILD